MMFCQKYRRKSLTWPHTETWRPISGDMFSRCFELRARTEVFPSWKNLLQLLLWYVEWLWKLHFAVDLKMLFNEFRLTLAGNTVLLCKTSIVGKSFPLGLYCRSLRECQAALGASHAVKSWNKKEEPIHVQTCGALMLWARTTFQAAFLRTWCELRGNLIFQNPLNCATEKFPHSCQLEVINLLWNDMLKDKYQEKNLVEFCNHLIRDEFAQLRSQAYGLMPVLAAPVCAERHFQRWSTQNLIAVRDKSFCDRLWFERTLTLTTRSTNASPSVGLTRVTEGYSVLLLSRPI